MNRDLYNVHCYPDDSQLHLSFSPKSLADQDAAIIAMAYQCKKLVVKNWMCSDKLTLNNGKTEIIITGTRPQLSKVKIDHIRVGACDIKPTTLGRTLGTWFDEKFTTATHITKICGAAFYHLHSIRRISTCPPMLHRL